MINPNDIVKSMQLEALTASEQMQLLAGIEKSIKNSRVQRKEMVKSNVDVVVNMLKRIEQDIRDRYDAVGNTIEKRVATIKDGRDGQDGQRGALGPAGRDGTNGRDGRDGVDGRNGVDGQDGVSVTDAKIDFDGSLVISLSNGREINVGEVVAPDLAEKIKIFTNNGSGSGGGGGGAVDSVNGRTGAVVLVAADVGAEPADATILKDADIGVTVQGYSSVLAGTTASFTAADETKLDGIAAGAEVNVNADWNATSGDAQILNKPTLGTAAAAATTDFATAAQGTKADSAIQPAAIGVTVQGYSSVLAGTTASFTTADETKLDGIAAGAEVNVNADWNAGSGDAQILNKPAILAFSGGITAIAKVSALPGSPDPNTLYIVV